MNPIETLLTLATTAADPATRAWLENALQAWLNGADLRALGLSGQDRQQARLVIRNHYLRAAWAQCPGDRFSIRFGVLCDAISRINRVRRGYQHLRKYGAIFDELEIAAQWGKLPNFDTPRHGGAPLPRAHGADFLLVMTSSRILRSAHAREGRCFW